MPRPTFSPDAYDQLVQLRDHHLEEARKIDSALDVLTSVSRLAGKAVALVGKVRAKMTGIRPTRNSGAADIVRQHADFNAPGRPTDEINRLTEIAHANGIAVSRSAVSASYYVERKKRMSAPAAPAQPSLLDTEMTTRTFAEKFGDTRAPVIYSEARRLVALAKAQGLPEQRFTQRAFESVLRRIKKGIGGKAAAVAARRVGETNASKRARMAKLKRSGDRPMDRIRRVMRDADAPLDRDTIAERAKIVEVIPDAKYLKQSTMKSIEALVRAKEIRKTSAGYVAFRLKADDVGANGAHA